MPGLLPFSVVASPDIAVLLLLLPGQAPVAGLQAALQRQLGAGVRVLQVDEATYPTVVRSFAPTQLPTTVLVHQGVELWRQPGLPNGEEVHAVLRARGH